MRAILAGEPDEDKVVIRGKLRGCYHRDGQPFVGSRFRGVCRNGQNYQMFIMVDGQHKMYKGGFSSAREAGLAYDEAAIQLRGLRVRPGGE